MRSILIRGRRRRSAWNGWFPVAVMFLERLAKGLCPHCGDDPKEFVQVGRCVYAKPCGHRLGTVDAAAMRRLQSKRRRG